MIQNDSSFAHVRKIENNPKWISYTTLFLLVFLIIVSIWFFKGGSFKLFASLFFALYFLTKQAWLSIILVSIVQNIVFIPFRVIGQIFHLDFKNFNDELNKTKEDKQYLLFSKKVAEGNFAIVFYILNFVLLSIAYFSAGRVFLLDFYHNYISTNYLYNFIPYPQYPLQGSLFYFPFFKITKTISIDNQSILMFWLYFVGIFVVARLAWRLILSIFLSKSKRILSIRFKYNRVLIFFSGFAGTLFVSSFFFLKHVPVSFESIYLIADISQKNTIFNMVTALCTFFVTFYSGYKHNKDGIREAQLKNIPQKIIDKVSKENLQRSARNGFMLSLFAFIITHQMPCSHDLSILSFQAVYLLSPYTFDRFLGISPRKH